MSFLTIIFLFIWLTYGLSNMIVFASGPFHIFKKTRTLFNKISPQLGEFISCMICFPTWVGIGLSALNLFVFKDVSLTPFNVVFNGETEWYSYLACMLFDGALASGTTWFIHNVEEFFELRK